MLRKIHRLSDHSHNNTIISYELTGSYVMLKQRHWVKGMTICVILQTLIILEFIQSRHISTLSTGGSVLCWLLFCLRRLGQSLQSVHRPNCACTLPSYCYYPRPFTVLRSCTLFPHPSQTTTATTQSVLRPIVCHFVPSLVIIFCNTLHELKHE